MPAKTQFTAFSSLFQNSANTSKFSSGKPHASTNTKPTQSALKREITTPTNSKNTPINAQQETNPPTLTKKRHTKMRAFLHEFPLQASFPPR